MSQVLLLYGLAFILLGTTLALQARVPVRALSQRALSLLAGFALTHGGAEWLRFWTHVRPESAGVLAIPYIVAFCLSFALLLQFGIEANGRRGRWPKWSFAVPSILLMAFAITLATPSPPSLASIEAVARYVLGLPGAALSALALLRLAVDGQPRPRRQRVVSIAAAMTFVAYALLAGLIVPRAPFPPASFVHTEAFRAATGIPVEVLRAACALSLGFLLTELFVIETARAHARAEQLREEFISVVAHDLRNAINVISLSARMLERRSAEPRDAERERKQVERIEDGARALTRMVDDLLEASRIEAKRLSLRTEKLDLSRLVPEIAERTADATAGHPIKLDTPASGAFVVADPTRVEQVLVNLLSNAGKYSHPGTEITLEVRALGNEVVTSVRNIGSPISVEDLPRVFTRFYRTKSAAASRVRGLGLGLYIAKGLVEAHGGRIFVDSGPGDTTTFSFTLPAAPRGVRGE